MLVACRIVRGVRSPPDSPRLRSRCCWRSTLVRPRRRHRGGDRVDAKPRRRSPRCTIKAYKYRPDKFAVSVGVPVTVKNKDGVQHDLAAVNGKFKTKIIDGGKSGKFTVKKPGTYKIVCTLHTYMTGVIKAA